MLRTAYRLSIPKFCFIFTLNTECRGTSRPQSELDYIVSGSLFLFHKVMQELLLRNELACEVHLAQASSCSMKRHPRKLCSEVCQDTAGWEHPFCTEKALLRNEMAFGVRLYRNWASVEPNTRGPHLTPECTWSASAAGPWKLPLQNAPGLRLPPHGTKCLHCQRRRFWIMQ